MKLCFCRIVFVFSFLFNCTPFAHAQTSQPSLSGQITDTSKDAVAGVRLILIPRAGGKRQTATSDAAGDYRFQSVSVGEYLLEAEAQGFARAVRQLEFSTGTALRADVTLEVGGLSESVIVTPAGTPQTTDQISKAVTLIATDEIEKRGVFSLGEAVRLVPGLRVQQLGGPGALVTIRTRGLRNEDTAVLIDGQRIRDASAIAGDASAIIQDLLIVSEGRVEVLRGSGSSLYGTNAIGGVINMIGGEPGNSHHGLLQFEGGSLGMLRGRATVSGGFLENRLLYSAGLASLNVRTGLDKNDVARNTGSQLFVKYQPNQLASITARIFASRAFSALNDSPDVAPNPDLPATGVIKAVPVSFDQQRLIESNLPWVPGGASFIPDLNNPDYSRRSKVFLAASTYDQRFGQAVNFRLSYQGLRTSRVFQDGPAGSGFQPEFTAASTYRSEIDTINARFDFLVGRSSLLTAGYEFERDAFDDLEQDTNPVHSLRIDAGTRVAEHSHTIYVQHQMRLLKDRLQLSFAFRSQHFRLAVPEFRGGQPVYTASGIAIPGRALTGDTSVAYFIRSTKTKLRAHVGNGYRAPSLFERFGTGYYAGSFSPYGDPRLRPDRSIAADGGIDQSFARGRLTASASYFYTRLQEIISFDFSGLINPSTDPFGRFGGYRNAGGGLARGVELSAKLAPNRTTEVAASFTYTNSDQRSPSSVAGYIPAFGVSDRMFTLFITQRLGKRLDAVFDLLAASNYVIPLGYPSRAFEFHGPITGNLGASYTVQTGAERSIRFYGKVNNFLNRTYFENGIRTPGVTLIGGLGFRY